MPDVTYEIKVAGADVPGNGTDGNVHVRINGEKGERTCARRARWRAPASPPQAAKHGGDGAHGTFGCAGATNEVTLWDACERGGAYTTSLMAPDLGKIQSVTFLLK